MPPKLLLDFCLTQDLRVKERHGSGMPARRRLEVGWRPELAFSADALQHHRSAVHRLCSMLSGHTCARSSAINEVLDLLEKGAPYHCLLQDPTPAIPRLLQSLPPLITSM